MLGGRLGPGKGGELVNAGEGGELVNAGGLGRR